MSNVDIKIIFWLQYADNREWLSKLILFVYKYTNFGRLKLNFSMINILNLADPEIYSLIRNGSETDLITAFVLKLRFCELRWRILELVYPEFIA